MRSEAQGNVARMSIGKAEAHGPERAATSGFSCAVPCLDRIDEQTIKDHLANDEFVWVDLTAPSEEEVRRLKDLFGFHPLALEDALHFGQRPKLDDYQDYVLLVFYGAHSEAEQEEALLHEVLMFISGTYLVTLHKRPLPALEQQRERLDGWCCTASSSCSIASSTRSRTASSHRWRAWTTKSMSSRRRSCGSPRTISCSGYSR